MNGRSNFIFGKDFFLKLIEINDEDSVLLKKSLKNGDMYSPFSCVEFLSNYYISKTNEEENIKLLSPNTKVYVSSKEYDTNKISVSSYYRNVEEKIRKDSFIPFQKYGENFNIKTVIILSKRVTGNLDDFLKSNPSSKEIEDCLIHISYLFSVLAEKYGAVHGDPKTPNFTWLKLESPTDIEYRFLPFDSKEMIYIDRKNVKHIFFLTDLEFLHSQRVFEFNGNYFNFTEIHSYLDDNRKDIYYVPNITKNFAENYADLFGGYLQKDAPVYSRMFVKDIFCLVRMIISYGYTSFFHTDIIRKLNMYVSRFVSLSHEEEDPERRYNVNYFKVSPYSLSLLLNS